MAFFAFLDHKKLEQEMEEKNLKQEPFAEQLGISDRHLRNLCSRNTAVSSTLLYNISRALDKPMEEFLVVEEDTFDP